MSTKTRKLAVEILGDASSLAKSFKESEQAGNKWQRAMGKASGPLKALAKGGALAGAALGTGLAAAAAIGVKGLMADEVALNKVNSALKSTGGVAKVTEKDITSLASALQAKTGVGADEIMTNQSLLLTFTNLRNEAGKGNKVFDEATKIALDMSKAMGQDMKASSIQVGKALNDPIKGVGALSKVGVQFTEQQKEQIKTLVESGNTLGAQKVILGELQTQFGGTAEAMGETLQGKIDRSKRAFEEVAKVLAGALLPILAEFATWLLEVGIPAMQSLADWISKHAPAMRAHLVGAWENIRAAAEVAITWYGANVAPVVASVSATITTIINGLVTFWRRFGDDIVNVARTSFGLMFTAVSGIVRQLTAAIQLVMAVFRGDWSAAWDAVKTLALNPIKTLKTLLVDTVKGFLPALAGLALNVGKGLAGKIWDGVKQGPLGEIAGFVKDKTIGIFTGAGGILGLMFDKGNELAGKLKSGAREGMVDVGKAVGNAFLGFVNKIIGWLQKIPLVGDKLEKVELLANGGVINRATFAVVGEDGPEAVIPLGPKRRKRGAELLTQAARIMGMPGDFSGPASVNRRLAPGEIPFLADGAIIMPNATSWADTQARMLARNDDPGILKRIGNWAAQGLGSIIGAMPDPPDLAHPIGALARAVKESLEQAVRGLWAQRDKWDPGQLMAAYDWAKAQMGKPYVWGGGHAGWNYGLGGYDCSGFASHVAKKAGAALSGPGTTMTLHPMGRAGNSGDRMTFGFRGMQYSDPRKQHMGIRALGTWFQFGNPGRSGGGDGQWNSFRTIPGMPGYAQGTPFVPETGPALLHRGEAVIPAREAEALRNGVAGATGPLVHVDTMVVQEPGDADRLAAQLGRRISLGVAA